MKLTVNVMAISDNVGIDFITFNHGMTHLCYKMWESNAMVYFTVRIKRPDHSHTLHDFEFEENEYF